MSLDRLALVAVGALICVALGGCRSDEGGASDGAAAPQSAEGGAGGERIEVAGEDALVWGKGEYGVVLAHGAAFDAASWEAQATRIADQGMVALAVEDIAPEGIVAAGEYLKRERGVQNVALVGGSAGADAILAVASQEPGFFRSADPSVREPDRRWSRPRAQALHRKRGRAGGWRVARAGGEGPGG